MYSSIRSLAPSAMSPLWMLLAGLLSASGSMQRRILSVADLHGDFRQTSGILRNLGLMDEAGGWAGGRDVLIQTGDIADRGQEELDVYKALFRLQDEAPASGGEVIILLGNHELMNLQGDYQFASKQTNISLGGSSANRTEVFSPSGWLGRRLRQRGQLVARIGEAYGFTHPVVYTHAGILPAYAAEVDRRLEGLGVDDAGQQAADALNAAVRQRLVDRTWEELSADNATHFSDAGPLWTRRLAKPFDVDVCVELEQSLRVFGATRMVVGHTPQSNGKVNHRCQGRLVLADTVISSAYHGGGHPSAVEVSPEGEAYALYPGTVDARAREVLPRVQLLPQDIAVEIGGEPLAPRLRWFLRVLGLDITPDGNETPPALPSSKQVRRTYHRLSLTRHPDKGGTQEGFQELQAAFEAVLHHLVGVAT